MLRNKEVGKGWIRQTKLSVLKSEHALIKVDIKIMKFKLIATHFVLPTCVLDKQQIV